MPESTGSVISSLLTAALSVFPLAVAGIRSVGTMKAGIMVGGRGRLDRSHRMKSDLSPANPTSNTTKATKMPEGSPGRKEAAAFTIAPLETRTMTLATSSSSTRKPWILTWPSSSSRPSTSSVPSGRSLPLSPER